MMTISHVVRSWIRPPVLIVISLLTAVIALREFIFVRFTLMMILLLFSVVLACAGVIAKQRRSYLRGQIRLAGFICNCILEITGLLLVMIATGWLGHSIALLATRQIDDELAKLIAGMAIGLLVGTSLGVLVQLLGAKLRPSQTQAPEGRP